MNRYSIFRHHDVVQEFQALEYRNHELSKEHESTLEKLKNLKFANSELVSENEQLKQRNTILEDAFLKYSPLFDLNYLYPGSQIKHWRTIWSKWNFVDEGDAKFRKQRACEYRYTPLFLDKQNGCATFMGIDYEKYHTTLLKCECHDFLKHFRPCKHMYRLAHELDVEMLDDDVFYVDEPKKLIPLNSYKTSILPTLSATEIETLSILSYKPCCIVSVSSVKTLLSKNIVKICEDKYFLLNSYNRDDLVRFLSSDDTFKRSSKKDDLITHLINNYSDTINQIERVKVAVKVSPYEEHLIKYF